MGLENREHGVSDRKQGLKGPECHAKQLKPHSLDWRALTWPEAVDACSGAVVKAAFQQQRRRRGDQAVVNNRQGSEPRCSRERTAGGGSRPWVKSKKDYPRWGQVWWPSKRRGLYRNATLFSSAVPLSFTGGVRSGFCFWTQTA